MKLWACRGVAVVGGLVLGLAACSEAPNEEETVAVSEAAVVVAGDDGDGEAGEPSIGVCTCYCVSPISGRGPGGTSVTNRWTCEELLDGNLCTFLIYPYPGNVGYPVEGKTSCTFREAKATPLPG